MKHIIEHRKHVGQHKTDWQIRCKKCGRKAMNKYELVHVFGEECKGKGDKK